jgi:hypothetical protein
MKKLFRRVFGSIGGFLIAIHGVGIVISDFVFSYRYIKEHGLFEWLFLGEIVTTLKAVVWEIFFVLALVEGGADSGSLVKPSTQDALWIYEYPALVQAVETAKNQTLSTSYRAGPCGEAEVELTLIRKPNDGLILKLGLPSQAVFSVDRQTGDKIRNDSRHRIIIRDHNLDGLPDDFRMESSGDPLYEEQITEDGFIKYRDSREHQAIAIQWVIGIGYSTNYFLHGVSSFMPR